MWIYEQSTGDLYNDRTDPPSKLATGYSGYGPGLNNPALQHVPQIGPIPEGIYTVLEPRNTTSHGPYVLGLEPDPANEMFGRGGFLIHGDEIANAGKHLASHGCIILSRLARAQIWSYGDHSLRVVRTLNA
jgi:hypothetical protein